ncbi:uncharacterized protein LOC115684466 [Syzygium oleosum]|uniref:uncharacterized protein LOC115684466 n=1 Tax=Syzygium oleosum TaxID=219896 RepID=UPI0024B9A0A0|nr:uncharacterized protein LOC115684466 [Syzygium oleosum]
MEILHILESENSNACRGSKLLSNYMIYLFALHPYMLSLTIIDVTLKYACCILRPFLRYRDYEEEISTLSSPDGDVPHPVKPSTVGRDAKTLSTTWRYHMEPSVPVPGSYRNRTGTGPGTGTDPLSPAKNPNSLSFFPNFPSLGYSSIPLSLPLPTPTTRRDPLASPRSVRRLPRLFLCLHQPRSGSSATEVGFASRLQATSFVFVFVQAHTPPHAHPLELAVSALPPLVSPQDRRRFSPDVVPLRAREKILDKQLHSLLEQLVAKQAQAEALVSEVHQKEKELEGLSGLWKRLESNSLEVNATRNRFGRSIFDKVLLLQIT